MKTLASALTVVCLVLGLARPAQAGQARCWLDQGVVVVPATVAGVAGDYILDTGAARTLLHETRAQGAGLTQTALTAEIDVAGLRVTRHIVVADLDARTAGFPTPIAGVLGADLLDGLILDVSFDPCRVGVYARTAAPRFRAARVLPLRRVEGGLAAPAVATDGTRLLTGDFVLSTGLGHDLHIDASLTAATAGGPEVRRRLRALSFAGDLQENVETEVGVAGPAAGLGAPALSRYRLRFDLARGRLSIAPRKGPPERSDGP